MNNTNTSNLANKKIYLIAGESSGDIIGSSLMNSLKKKAPNIKFVGIGGIEMEKAGLKSFIPMESLSVMGFIEVLLKIFFFNRLIKKTIANIIEENPDCLITIDSLGFNKRVAKGVKQLNPNITLIHYVAPSVWAWKPKRAKELANIYNYLLCLFKFEIPYFEKEHLKTYFVGHPIVESPIIDAKKENLIAKYNLNPNSQYILLMPGSRITEVSRLLPIFCEAVSILQKKYPNIEVIIPVVPHMYNYIQNYLNTNNLKFLILQSKYDKYDAFALCKIGIIASGTASLELAMAKLPTLVAYKINPLTAWIAYKLVKIKYASIVNIMTNQEIIKELIQKDCTTENIVNYVDNFLQNDYINNYEEKILSVLTQIGYKTFIPSEKASEVILDILTYKTGL
jgi:lipid-A-disaccharide synthase